MLRRFARVALLAVVALLGAGSAACYDTPRPACGFTCGKDGACPDGYVCGASLRCRLHSVPESQCAAAEPGMPDAMPAPTPDAPIDAPIDAMPDSMPDGMEDAGADAPTDAPLDAAAARATP